MGVPSEYDTTANIDCTPILEEPGNPVEGLIVLTMLIAKNLLLPVAFVKAPIIL